MVKSVISYQGAQILLADRTRAQGPLVPLWTQTDAQSLSGVWSHLRLRFLCPIRRHSESVVGVYLASVHS